ncbi:NAD(P)/FAD-dependent oxidoreductase [Neptuniibacter halophilus]|uniref:NAD(P)/FAD-dependent oxidoreductase n=1 Tax=Neptuniibacter halophilus TaxID=651666 RepID=UPI002572DDBA|nr:FAD-binding oxidoreductase [Neptuniibacter halophilus]
MKCYQDTSYWFTTLNHAQPHRPALEHDIEADVVIVGAGYTGLWTAYYLKQHAPDLSIAILEAETVGFGASGRNGGWLIGSCAGHEKYLAGLAPVAAARCRQLLLGIVDHVCGIISKEQIDCDYQRGGVVYAAARYPEQLQFQRHHLEHLYQAGYDETQFRWLNETELEELVRMRNPLGAIYSPYCATINPARLVKGLARVVEGLGVKIFEQTPVTAIRQGSVETRKGQVRSPVIVPALEGYARSVPGAKGQYLLPVQSLIVATEPLSAAQWDEVGLETRPAFSDGGRLVTYGQRTADGRLIFGARGAYLFGGKPQSRFALEDPEFQLRANLMRDIFPALEGVNVTHGWGGTLSISRRFAPHALFDRDSGLALAGGYGGEGVGASNLFARTLADLILQRETELTTMPWVQQNPQRHNLRRWEPEPFRWLAYKAIMAGCAWEESLCNHPHAATWKKRIASSTAGMLAGLME